MAFRRVVVPDAWATGSDLTAAMAGIGMNLAAEPAPQPNVEDTLVAASMEGMEHDDLRVLDLLIAWLETHHRLVNADRLIRATSSLESRRVRALWAAAAAWLHEDRRLSRLAQLHDGPPVDLLRSGTEFLLSRNGEDARFLGSPLRVPAGVIRVRKADVLPAADLARRHRTIYYRILMGPSYRADMWAELERNPDLSAADLARRAYGSFATAWQVKRDRELVAA